MYLKLKSAKITDWWIAKENEKMSFVNILTNRHLEGNFLIVGYLDKSRQVLATSTNYIVRITMEGVITSQGTFYPFSQAHELYLRFLIKANVDNTLIANRWDFVNSDSKNMIIADIINKDPIEKGVTFDFIPDESDFILSGYSVSLRSNVVISTFSKRNTCIILNIPSSVKDDIFNSSFALHDESCKRLEEFKNTFGNNVKDVCINVKVRQN